MTSNPDIRPRSLELSSAKRELLAQRVRGAFRASDSISGIPCRSTDGPAPLSFAQERLWLINQIEPESDAYNQPLAVKLAGPLHPDLLEECLNQIVQRHEVLRATFPACDGKPAQVVEPFKNRPLPITDLSQS